MCVGSACREPRCAAAKAAEVRAGRETPEPGKGRDARTTESKANLRVITPPAAPRTRARSGALGHPRLRRADERRCAPRAGHARRVPPGATRPGRRRPSPPAQHPAANASVYASKSSPLTKPLLSRSAVQSPTSKAATKASKSSPLTKPLRSKSEKHLVQLMK